jgi:hypothetical protein
MAGDIYCRFCDEPVAMDEFHNGTDSFADIWTLFRKLGCPVADKAVEGMSAEEIALEVTKRCQNRPIITPDRQLEIITVTDLLEDDIDGVSAMLEDFRWM